MEEMDRGSGRPHKTGEMMPWEDLFVDHMQSTSSEDEAYGPPSHVSTDSDPIVPFHPSNDTWGAASSSEQW